MLTRAVDPKVNTASRGDLGARLGCCHGGAERVTNGGESPMKRKIPMPKTINWLSHYGSWENLCQAIARSIGGRLGGGVIKFWNSPTNRRQTVEDSSQHSPGKSSSGTMD